MRKLNSHKRLIHKIFTFFQKKYVVFNLYKSHHFLVSSSPAFFCSFQHKPVLFHTVLGLNFIWSIYLCHKSHKKMTVLKVMAGHSSMSGWKCITRPKFLQLINYILNLVIQVDDILMFYEICIFLKSEFQLFIFVLAHFQKLLSRSIHFKTRVFFSSVFCR